MRVFVLCPQRCGSVTLAEACKHISNYSSGHETRQQLKFEYPDNHIEVDNRLVWFLGRLDYKYKDEPIYVHLRRDPNKVANSCLNRFNKGIMRGYHKRILLFKPNASKLDICRDYVDTVNTNIELFLKDKSKKMEIHVEQFENDFKSFWNFIKAEGSVDDALNELNKKHNKSKKYKIDYIKNNLFK